MGNLHFLQDLMEPSDLRSFNTARIVRQTSPNQAPIDKRRLKTIFNHFRDKPARLKLSFDMWYLEGAGRDRVLLCCPNSSPSSLPFLINLLIVLSETCSSSAASDTNTYGNPWPNSKWKQPQQPFHRYSPSSTLSS